MRPLVFAVALLLSGPALAAPALDIPSGGYVGDPTHTSVTFKVGHFGLSYYTARFAKVESTVTLDAASPARSNLMVTIDTNSVKTDFPFPEKEDFDRKVGNDANFLNGAQFPQISFVSKSIKVTGAKTAVITGELTLRGVTKPVTLDAVLNGTLVSPMFKNVPKFGISATGKINRSDFGMTFGKGILGEEVDILVEAEFAQAPTK